MITLIGVGHVFAISENVKQIIRSRRPEVVCIELDPSRYYALMQKDTQRKVPLQYLVLARIQKRIAGKFGTEIGDEMLAAASAAGEIGAKLALIDMDAQRIFAELWRKMSLKEKVGLFVGAFMGLFASKEKLEKEVDSYQENDAMYIEKMGEEFPSVKEVLIDERNRFMASKVTSLATTHGNIVVVIGDGHVPGMMEQLKAQQVEVIRLKELRSGSNIPASGSAQYSASFWCGPQNP